MNREYTDEQVSKVRELAGSGMRDNQIAAELGISARAVAGLRHEHGIMAGIWHRKIVEQRTTGGGYAKTIGVLFDSVSIDGAASACAKLSKDWGRVAVFVEQHSDRQRPARLPVVVYSHVFTGMSDFEASRAAEAWCAGHGISVGEMQGPAPRGLLVGDFDISKWRNMSRKQIGALHGQMTGDHRNGPVRITLFDNCPPIPGVVE